MVQIFVFLVLFFWDWTKLFIVNSQHIRFQDRRLYEGDNCIRTNKERGICKYLRDCEDNIESYNYMTNCYFNGTNPIICCKNITANTIEEKSHRPSPLVNLNTIYAQTACLKIITGDSFAFGGGWLAKPGEHLHMAAIGWILDEGVIDWNCGGSLISWNYVLTAAHCVSKDFKPDIVRINDISVADIVPGDGSADFSIKNIFIHPDYNDEFVYHDLAILEVEKQTGGIYTPQPICIWPTNEIPVSQVFAMGYGTSSFGGPKTNVLYQGNLTLVDLEKCQKDYGQKSRYPTGIMDFQICAHDPEQSVDTCQGDSGGPLQISNKIRGKNFPFLIGVTSFGQNCLGLSPGVYIRIYPYVEWINSIVWKFNIDT